ncbi:MAG: hypothetical protein PHY71_04775 [Bacteroidaceae bacterium]|nr:hypothetical protein [Bacteroidaceae bacterium]
MKDLHEWFAGDVVSANDLNNNFKIVNGKVNLVLGEDLVAGDRVYFKNEGGVLKAYSIGTSFFDNTPVNVSALDGFSTTDWANIGDGYFLLSGITAVSTTIFVVMGHWDGSTMTWGTPYTFTGSGYGIMAYNEDNDNAIIPYNNGTADYNLYGKLLTLTRGTLSVTGTTKTLATLSGSYYAYTPLVLEYHKPTQKYILCFARYNGGWNGDSTFFFTESGGTITTSTELNIKTGSSNDISFLGFGPENAIIGTGGNYNSGYQIDMTQSNPALLTSIYYTGTKYAYNNRLLCRLHQDSVNTKNIFLGKSQDGENAEIISFTISSFCNLMNKINTLANSTLNAIDGGSCTINEFNATLIINRYYLSYPMIVKRDNTLVNLSYGITEIGPYNVHCVHLGNGMMMFCCKDNADSNKFKYKLVGVANLANFEGILQESGSTGDTKEIAINGGESSVHTSLTVGDYYYLQEDGTISNSPTGFHIGKAVSATNILLDIK